MYRYPPMSESPSKVVPRSPYVEDETDEEFVWEKEIATEAEAETDDRTCRICFSGQDEADTLGRLISPCKCRYIGTYSLFRSILYRGTMKWIHVECLNQWRKASKKESRYVQGAPRVTLTPAFSAVMNVDRSTPSESIQLTFSLLDVNSHGPSDNDILAIQTALTLAIFTGTAFTLGSLIKLALFVTRTQISVHPQTISIPASPAAPPLVLSAPKSIHDVLNYRDPAHWVFGLATLGIVGFTQMLLVGGMVFNLGDVFGLRRIWGGGREGEGRAEIRIGGFFGGGILWVVMILVGLGRYVPRLCAIDRIEHYYQCTDL